MRISKRDGTAVLVIEMVQSSGGFGVHVEKLRTVSQCLPITILAHTLNHTLMEPKLPNPEVGVGVGVGVGVFPVLWVL